MYKKAEKFEILTMCILTWFVQYFACHAWTHSKTSLFNDGCYFAGITIAFIGLRFFSKHLITWSLGSHVTHMFIIICVGLFVCSIYVIFVYHGFLFISKRIIAMTIMTLLSNVVATTFVELAEAL